MRLSCSLLAAGVALLSTVHAAKFADSYKGTDFELTAIYDSSANSTAFTLQSSKTGSEYGWKGIGTGTGMRGSNMVITWVNSDGSVTVSNRYSSEKMMPSTSTALTLPAITRNTAGTTATSSGTTVQWTQQNFPTNAHPLNAVMMGWAYSATGPSSAAQDASFNKHDEAGQLTLDLTKPYDGGAVASSSTGEANGGGAEEEAADHSMSKRNMIIWAHMIIGIVAWLLILPLGILIGRFGRTTLRSWFKAHRAIQSVGLLLVIVTMFLGFGSIWAQGPKAQGSHLTEVHHKAGLALSLLAVFQAVLGYVGHKVFHARGVRVQNYVHIVIGLALIPLAAWNMGMGFPLWEWQAPDAAPYPLYAWTGALALVYILGLVVCLPRERRADRRRRQEKDAEKTLVADVRRTDSDTSSVPSKKMEA